MRYLLEDIARKFLEHRVGNQVAPENSNVQHLPVSLDQQLTRTLLILQSGEARSGFGYHPRGPAPPRSHDKA